MNFTVFLGLISITFVVFQSTALFSWDGITTNALISDADPLQQTGIDIGAAEFSSSTLPLSIGPAIIPDPGASIRDNLLGNLTANVLDRFETFLDSKPIDSFSDAKCIASAITGGDDGISERGLLIMGTNCDDKIKGSDKDEIIYTLGGVDRVFADAGNDIIYGGMGSDRLYGEEGDDIVIAGAGENLLDGGPGTDVLSGGAGSNFLIGGDEDDELIAGIGTTVMFGGSGSNSFDCGLLPGKTIVLDYNPNKGDTIAGQCKIVNNVGMDLPGDIEIPVDDN